MQTSLPSRRFVLSAHTTWLGIISISRCNRLVKCINIAFATCRYKRYFSSFSTLLDEEQKIRRQKETPLSCPSRKKKTIEVLLSHWPWLQNRIFQVLFFSRPIAIMLSGVYCRVDNSNRSSKGLEMVWDTSTKIYPPFTEPSALRYIILGACSCIPYVQWRPYG